MGNAFGTIAVVLVMAATLYRLRRRFLRSHHDRVRWRAEKIGWPLVVASLFAALLGAVSSVPSMPMQGALVVLGSVSLAVGASIDLCCRQHLGSAPLTVWRNIPFTTAGFSVPVLASTYLAALLPRRLVLATASLFIATWALIHAFGLSVDLWISAPLIFASLLAWALLERLRARPELPEEVWAALLHEPEPLRFNGNPGEFYAADRSDAYRLDGPAPVLPRTILLVINESAGGFLPSSDGTESLADRIAALSGRPDEWVIPGNVVTNSSCTDISFPSILTGAGSHEGVEALHRLPFVFDLAKARGYRTALLMSSVLKWLNVDRFLSAAPIDELYSAETSGRPIINDLGIDDAFTVRRFEAMLDKEQGPVFAVIFLNALHVPFQADSAFPLDAGLRDRRARALTVTEQAHRHLFEVLRRSGRFDDALIFSIGDHGELPGLQDHPQATIPRLENLNDWVLRPLFLLKPPRGLPPEMAAALNRNVESLIANVDIAPSLAHLLGATLSDGLTYTGHSLFEPIPADRVAVATNANEWRPWDGRAVALARGRERLICDRYDFLRYESGDPLDPGAASPGRKELMDTAMQIATVRQNIAHIYREHA